MSETKVVVSSSDCNDESLNYPDTLTIGRCEKCIMFDIDVGETQGCCNSPHVDRNSKNPTPRLDTLDVEESWGVVVGPKFGCVHWNKK